MTAEYDDGAAAQVHWLVAGQFGLGARGESLRLTRADFDEALQKAGLTAQATIVDPVSGLDRAVSLKVDSLKVFTLKHVVASVPELAELAKKADEIAKLKDPTIDDLKRLVGEGPLYDELRVLLEPEDETSSSSASGKSDGEITGDTDAIFEKAQVQKPTAKSAIDMFVKATAISTRKKPKPAERQLRDRVEAAVWGMAAEVLRDPSVQQIETAWRGLRLLLTECPKGAQMQVVLLETDPEHVLDDLAKRERADDVDEPDCLFVPHDFETTDGLAELADFAEQELIPVVVGARSSLFGEDDPQAVPDAFETLDRARNEDVPEWAARWDELRMKEPTRWLCAVANRVALHTEGKGVAARTTFGSGVWAVAAMLASSYRHTGGFARIFGKAGSLRAPATHTIERGSDRDTAAPTEAFYAIRPCETLAKNGVLGVGSARNSDQIALIKAPMVRGTPDAVPLPAQILTGRVARFAGWVKAQLPEGCDSQTANDIFTSAASVFLFPGQEQAAEVRATTTNVDGEAHVLVQAAANPAIASIPFEIAFSLPLGWSVPAPSDDASEGDKAASSAGSAEKAGDTGSLAREDAEGGRDAKSEEGGGIASASVGFDAGLGRDKQD